MKEPESLFLPENSLGIVTDLYQITMVMDILTSISRILQPLSCQFVTYLKIVLISLRTGLEQALHYLTHIKFSAEAIQIYKTITYL